MQAATDGDAFLAQPHVTISIFGIAPRENALGAPLARGADDGGPQALRPPRPSQRRAPRSRTAWRGGGKDCNPTDTIEIARALGSPAEI